MFKIILAIFAIVACAAAKPGIVAPLAYSAPLVAPGIVTATSSQVFARNYNGLVAAPLVAANAPLAYTAPVAAARYVSPLAANQLAYTVPAVSSPFIRYANAAPVYF